MTAHADLKSYFDRINRLMDERDNLGTDIGEVYSEAKSKGFDTSALRKVVSDERKRAKDPAAFEEKQAITELYEEAIRKGTPVSGAERVAVAAGHFNAGNSVRATAKLMGVGVSEAGRLRQLADARGLLSRTPTVRDTSTAQEPVPDTDCPGQPEPSSEIEPAPTSTGDGGGDPHQDAIPLRAGGPVDHRQAGQSHQPPELSANDEARGPVAAPAMASVVLTSTDRLGRGLASLDPGPIPDFLIRPPASQETPQ